MTKNFLNLENMILSTKPAIPGNFVRLSIIDFGVF